MSKVAKIEREIMSKVQLKSSLEEVLQTPEDKTSGVDYKAVKRELVIVKSDIARLDKQHTQALKEQRINQLYTVQ